MVPDHSRVRWLSRIGVLRNHISHETVMVHISTTVSQDSPAQYIAGCPHQLRAFPEYLDALKDSGPGPDNIRYSFW